MVKCIECIHCDACKIIKLTHDIEETHLDTDLIQCDLFKSCDDFGEPPVKVGDFVWLIDSLDNTIKFYTVFTISLVFTPTGKFSRLSIKNERGSVLVDFSLQDLGKTIFLTKEEAEQALKERED